MREIKSKVVMLSDIMCLASILSFIIMNGIPFMQSLPLNLLNILKFLPISFFILAFFLKKTDSVKIQILLVISICILFDHILFITAWSDKVSLLSKHYSLLNFWFPILYLIYWKDRVYLINSKSVARMYFNILAITATTTIIALLFYPTAARDLAMTTKGMDINYLYRLNIGSYGIIYGMAFALPFVWTTDWTKKKWVKVLFTIIFSLCFIRASLTMVLMVEIVLAIICLVYNRDGETKRQSIISILILGVLMIVSVIVLISGRIGIYNIISSISEISFIRNNKLIYERIKGLAYLIGGISNQDDVSYRMLLYTRSWDNFLLNPLLGKFGNNALQYGSHSEILDTLAISGVFGFSLVLILFMIGLKKIKGSVEAIIKTYRFVFFVFLVVALINTVFYSPLVMFDLFFIPLLLFSDNKSKPVVL